MSVPKKFNETVNLKNRVESLNDLTFYTVRYDFKLAENYKENLHSEFDVDVEVTGIKEVSGLNEQQAMAKIDNWFTVLTDRKVLESFEIKSIERKSFYETLKDKKILDIIAVNNPQ